ncbi:MAG: hypothetical protein ACO25B_07920 [Chitinophagaceae bacterium]
MYIEINDNTTFREIQDVFSSFYPWLRLEFYQKGHKKYQSSPEREALPPGKKVSDFKKTHVSGLLEIRPPDKIATIEKELQTRFGLPVQVLRKQRNAWIQTTGMDSFTLKEANELSRNASDAYLVKDYDEGFETENINPSKLL